MRLGAKEDQMQEPYRSTLVVFGVGIALTIFAFAVDRDPADVSARQDSRVKATIANVEQSAKLTVQHEIFTVVSVQMDIPGFQRVVLRRRTHPDDLSLDNYFSGLAAQGQKFEPGQEVEVTDVAYALGDHAIDNFFMVRPKTKSGQ